MRVNYVTLGHPDIPSVRHRMRIPGSYIKNSFISPVPAEADIHVFSKPFTQDEVSIRAILEMSKTVPYIYDCWDNLFVRGGMEAEFTIRMIKNAEAVVCASEWLVGEIRRQTGVEAQLIQDPLEYLQQPIKTLDTIKALWFGTSTNLHILRRLKLPFKLTIISNYDEYTQKVLGKLNFEYDFREWSPDRQWQAMSEHNLMVIPGYDDPAIWAKSANRVAEAINAGMSVIAWPIPAYKQFDKYVTLSTHIDEDISNVKQITEEAQQYVTRTFSRESIGEQWRELFNHVHRQLQHPENGHLQLA